jgi:hypothetical protein
MHNVVSYTAEESMEIPNLDEYVSDFPNNFEEV